MIQSVQKLLRPPGWLTICLLLLIPIISQAQLTINGRLSVCNNSVTAYALSTAPTSGLNYTWTMSPAIGTFSNLYGTTTAVSWAGPGTTTITLQGKNATGAVVQSGTITVTVQPSVQPVITTNYRVGCQTFPDDPPKDPQGPPKSTPLFGDDACAKVCEGSWVTYTANGLPGSFFQWTVSGGTAYYTGGNTVIVNWGAVGLGSIAVTEMTHDSCEGSRTMCVEIIHKPHARFGALPDTTQSTINICKNSSVIFVDHSYAVAGSPIVNWYWDFGDGTTLSSSASTNPTHTYTTPPNNYRAFLVVKNACNCTDTAWLDINVNEMEGVKISCAAVACENSTGTYTLNMPGGFSCGSNDWSVMGGTIVSPMPYTTSIDITWDAVDDDGFGYVLFDASSCGGFCPGVTALKIPVIKSNGTIKGTQYVCADNAYKYTLPAWPGTVYNWSVSNPSLGYISHTDQPNEIVVHTNSSAGTLNVLCSYTNSLVGCGGSASFPVTILAQDSIIGNKTACINTSASYTLFNGNTGNWTLTAPDGTTSSYSGTGSVTPTFTQAGTYSLSVAGTTFCSPEPLQIKVLGLPPVPNYILGPDTTCLNVPYTFSVGTVRPGSVFNWTVTGGNVIGVASGKTVTVQFTSATGPYIVTVSRSLTESPFCVGPSISKVLLKPAININITGKDTVCPNTVWTYNAGYTFGETYEWSLANPLHGSIDDNKKQTVNVTWNNQTVQTIAQLKLVVSRCGIKDSQIFQVVIRPAPAFTLNSAADVCRDMALPVSIFPTPTSGTLQWSSPYAAATGPVTIPGGSASTTYVFTDIASANLTKTIYVDITNPNGCPGTIRVTKDITVKPAPVALVTPLGDIGACVPFTKVLTATLQSGAGATALLAWTGVAASCGPPFVSCGNVSVNNYGSYYVTATGVNGCIAVSNTVRIFQACSDMDTGGDVCILDTSLKFSPVATNNCGHVSMNMPVILGTIVGSVAYKVPPQAYNISSSNTSTTATMQCDMKAAGYYGFGMTLTLRDNFGNECVRETGFPVVVPAVPALVYKLTCANGSGFSVELIDHSSYLPGSNLVINGYDFKLGGSSWMSSSTPSYLFNSVTPNSTQTGYVVFRYTYNGVPASCTASVSIAVPSIPVAAFTPSVPTACVTQKAILFNSTATVGANEFLWNFIDGSSITIPSPTKTFTTLGTIPVTLSVGNGFGCTDTLTKFVTITDNFLKGNLTVSPSVICESSLASLSYSPGPSIFDIPSLYTWMNDVDTVQVTTTSPLPVSQSGNYWIHASSTAGCWRNTPTRALSVLYVPDAIITGDSLQCFGNTFTLQGYAGSAAGINYAWTRNGSPAGSTPNLIQIGLPAGTYNYQLTISISSGGTTCSKVSTIFKVEVHNPPAAPTVSYNVSNCDPYTINLFASPGSSGTYNWSNGATGNPAISYVGGPHKVWYTDLYGCQVSAEADVAKDPRGYLWIFPSGCYEACPPVTVPGPIIPFVNWNYFDASGPLLSGSNSVPGPFTISASGTYGLFLDNGWCSTKSEPLDITLKDNCTSCADITASAVIEYTNFCQVFPYFTFNNTSPGAATYVITSNIGSMTPPNNMGSIPPGYTGFADRWIPPGGFFSGNVTFTITFTLYDGSTCKTTLTRYVSCPQGGPVHRLSKPQGSTAQLLSLAPNPASGSVAVSYRYGAIAETMESVRSLELYDVLGRRFAAYDAGQAPEGVWNLGLGSVAPGNYQVVMRDGGKVVATARLTVTK